MEDKFAKMVVKLKSGQERFTVGQKDLGFDLLQFWRWSGSDLISNTARGVLAEYIVANALGIAGHGLRVEWDAFDLKTPVGLKIEVKSSAYLQTWQQNGFSKISFGIQRTRKWDSVTNTMVGELRRQADVYVFSLLATQNPNQLNPLNVEQWEFYILPTSVLDEKCVEQKSIGLRALQLLGATSAKYDQLADRINRLEIVPR